MTEKYNTNTLRILDLWLQRLNQKEDKDPQVLAQIQNLIHIGQVDSEEKTREIISSLREKLNA